LTIVTSPFLPASNEPISSSQPSAFAASMVIISSSLPGGS